MKIKIKNLLVRTIIGFKEWERKKKQDIIINISMYLDNPPAIETDKVEDSIDYKIISKKIIEEVEKTNFFLIEKLAGFILEIVMKNKKIKRAVVIVEKPHALRFSESVSVKLEQKR